MIIEICCIGFVILVVAGTYIGGKIRQKRTKQQNELANYIQKTERAVEEHEMFGPIPQYHGFVGMREAAKRGDWDDLGKGTSTITVGDAGETQGEPIPAVIGEYRDYVKYSPPPTRKRKLVTKRKKKSTKRRKNVNSTKRTN
jgi:hypothetical protein